MISNEQGKSDIRYIVTKWYLNQIMKLPKQKTKYENYNDVHCSDVKPSKMPGEKQFPSVEGYVILSYATPEYKNPYQCQCKHRNNWIEFKFE